MKVGDSVLILAEAVPGTRRPITPGSVGTVIELPEEYPDFVVVRSPGIRGDDWLPEGTGWTLRAEDVEPFPPVLLQ